MKTIKQNLELAKSIVKTNKQTLELRKELKQKMFSLNLRNANLSISKDLL